MAIDKNFPALDMYGGEKYIEGLKCASHRLDKNKLFQLDARHIPFENIFDIIGMFDVLEHIDEDEKVLGRNLYYKTQRGLIIKVPQYNFYGVKLMRRLVKRRYSRNELWTKLKNSGFIIEYMTSFVSILIPLLLVSQAAILRRKNCMPSEEFNLDSILNFIFEFTMKLEQLLINKKVSLPFGSSLLAVAYKV